MKQILVVAALGLTLSLAVLGWTQGPAAPAGAALRLKGEFELSNGPVDSISLSRDGKFLAAAGGKFVEPSGLVTPAKLYIVAAGEARLLTVPSASCVVLSEDSKTLAVGHRDGTITLRSLASGKADVTLKGDPTSVNALAFSPDGKVLASTAGGPVRLWDVAKGAEKARLNGHTLPVSTLAFSRDGKVLASAGGREQSVRLWDVPTGKETAALTGFDLTVDEIALSGDGTLLVTKTGYGTVQLWDVRTGKVKATLVRGTEADSPWADGLALSEDGKILAWAEMKSGRGVYLDRRVLLWDVTAGKLRATLKHKDMLSSLAMSADGRLLASGSDGGALTVWDVATGKALVNRSAGTGFVGRLAFSGDGKLLASACREKVQLWEVAKVAGGEKGPKP